MPGTTSGPIAVGSSTSGPAPQAENPSPSTMPTIDGRQAKVTPWPADPAARARGTSGS